MANKVKYNLGCYSVRIFNIFNDKIKTNSSPNKHSETCYDFLCRTTTNTISTNKYYTSILLAHGDVWRQSPMFFQKDLCRGLQTLPRHFVPPLLQKGNLEHP